MKTKLGELKLLRLLGRGGMAEVYEAEETHLGTRYAVKILLAGEQTAENALEARFFAEGALLARLHHPRIVRVYDYGTDLETGRPYYVMDAVLDEEGGATSLDRVEGIDTDLVARWYEDLREALVYLHSKGIVHRDLKPQNALVGPDGHVVLVDFGVSQILDEQLRSAVRLQLTMNDSGVRSVRGTPGYMPPEVVNFGQYSMAGDLWALGVILYRLLTDSPYDSRTSRSALQDEMSAYGAEWGEIVPELLHEQPEGRIARPYSEVQELCRSRAALSSEKELDKALSEYHQVERRARHFAILVGVTCAGLFMTTGVAGWLGVRARSFHVDVARESDSGRKLRYEDVCPRMRDVPLGFQGVYYMAEPIAFKSASGDIQRASDGSVGKMTKAANLILKKAKRMSKKIDRLSARNSSKVDEQQKVAAYLLYSIATDLFWRVGDKTKALECRELALKCSGTSDLP